MIGNSEQSAGRLTIRRRIVGPCLFAFLASAMFFLEGWLFLFPAWTPLILVLVFGLLSFTVLIGAKSFRAAFGRACFVFAGLWLLLYPVGSAFFYRVSILRGGQEVVARRLSKMDKLAEEIFLLIVEPLATGWLPTLMAGISVAIGIFALRCGGPKAAKTEEQAPASYSGFAAVFQAKTAGAQGCSSGQRDDFEAQSEATTPSPNDASLRNSITSRRRTITG